MVIRHRDHARQVLALTVTLGRGTTFSIYDIMTEAEWAEVIGAGDAEYVVAGALTGALEGLRRHGVTAADVLSCPVVSPGGLVTGQDMAIAGGWIADGVLQEQDLLAQQASVTGTLREHRWTTDPARVTSLVLAVAVTAGHAVDHDRHLAGLGGGE